jgi:single-strand DNA-binding protein
MFNKAILIGRLVADPEMRVTTQGTNVAGFRIAVDRAYSKGEKKADFINITAWRHQAEFVCKYFSKGRPIGVDGSIQTREYTDREGNKRTAFEVVAERLFFVESKSASSASQSLPQEQGDDASAAYSSGSVDDFTILENDDDLPF